MNNETGSASPRRSLLLYKLLAINVPAIGVVVIAVWLAIDYMAAGYFATLIKDFGIAPAAPHRMFLEAIHRYLIWAAFVGLAIALTLSYVLTKRILSPLSEMAGVTRRIAAGDYGVRAQVDSNDEIGQLAGSFNHMADSLEKIERLRKMMVADAAHELRTPLTNMQGYLEGLRDGVIVPSKRTFAMLHSEVLRLVKLAESLLALAEADAVSAHALKTAEVSLPALVEESLSLAKAQFVHKHLSVTRRFPCGSASVAVDPDHLRRVLRNLLDNVLQYSTAGTEVVISAERANGAVKCEICNEGEPISPDNIAHIFERFFREDKSRSRNRGGAGIGLAIVKELVEAHRGEVGATSAGGRTTVWFTLPAAESVFIESLHNPC